MGLKLISCVYGKDTVLPKNARECPGENQQKRKGLNARLGCGWDPTKELSFPQRNTLNTLKLSEYTETSNRTTQNRTEHNTECFHSWLILSKCVEW